MPRGVYRRKKSKATQVRAEKPKRRYKETRNKIEVTADGTAQYQVADEVAVRDIEEADLRRQIKEWYDAAPTLADRQARKVALMGVMYSGPTKFNPQDFLKPGPDTVEQRQNRDGSTTFRWNGGQANTQNIPKEDTQPAWRNAADIAAGAASAKEMLSNPKTLTGQQKVPVLSVVPPASLIAQATAMRYGAFFAPRVDGKKGYGPYNWRDQPIEAHIYIDAALRHLMQWWDGDDFEIVYDDQGRMIDSVSHLAFALATIGILLDARANATLIDDRPKKRSMAASHLLSDHKMTRYEK